MTQNKVLILATIKSINRRKLKGLPFTREVVDRAGTKYEDTLCLVVRKFNYLFEKSWFS